MSTPNLKPEALAVEPASPSTMPESLGWQLRAALPPMRLHSVSLFDLQGDILWLSEGALGPDEQGFVVEALDELKGNSSGTHRESDFQDGRGAVFLAVRASRAELVGLVMILVDGKALSAGGLAARVMTPPVHAILQRLAIWLHPMAKAANGSAPNTAPTAAPTTDRATPSPKRPDATGTISMEVLAPQEVEQILTFELAQVTLPAGAAPTDSAPAKAAAPTRPAAPIKPVAPTKAAKSPEPAIEPEPVVGPDRAIEPEPVIGLDLRVHELVKLRPGGRMRRFQIVPRPLGSGATTGMTLGGTTLAGAPHDATDDAAEALVATLRDLVKWLGVSSHLTDRVPLAFALTVRRSAMAAKHLPDLIADCLQNAAGTDGIGFEIKESVYVRHRSQTERFVRTVEQLGGFLVIDDFTFDSGALELLRSKALRLVKVDPQLVAAALRDKLAQARIVAISQAARVLGVHCAAKRVDGETARRWLAAAGFDFAEGPLSEGSLTLASLAAELADSK